MNKRRTSLFIGTFCSFVERAKKSAKWTLNCLSFEWKSCRSIRVDPALLEQVHCYSWCVSLRLFHKNISEIITLMICSHFDCVLVRFFSLSKKLTFRKSILFKELQLNKWDNTISNAGLVNKNFQALLEERHESVTSKQNSLIHSTGITLRLIYILKKKRRNCACSLEYIHGQPRCLKTKSKLESWWMLDARKIYFLSLSSKR